MYYTIDLELADRILPSYCRISVIEWTDGSITDVYNSYIYPDCEIEDFMYERHKISNIDVDSAPTMVNVWKDVSKMIEKKMVFFTEGAKTITALQQRLDVDYLTLPDFDFGSLSSICRRTWSGEGKYDINTMTKSLNISSLPYNSLSDAISMGVIINKAMKLHGVSTVNDLYDKIGFAGGIVIGNHRVLYRTKKDKLSGEYYKIFPEC